MPPLILGVTMTDSLILDSLEIHNFRAFEHLLIEKLGRVNLIVGKNNVGKTCVLEALRYMSSVGSFEVIKEILTARNEFAFLDLEKYPLQTKNEFILSKSSEIIHSYYESRLVYRKENSLNLKLSDIIIKNINKNSDAFSKRFPHIFVSDKSINDKLRVATLWDNIYLTDSEEDVINILRIIEPNVKSIGFVEDKQEKDKRVPMIRLSTLKSPILLSVLGEGMNRLLGIALALVNSKDGFLLIDEIDNGIHYSAQPDLWRLIFEGAKRMNVQVFATTHSWDCIEAFQQAATESGTDDGMLISLRKKKKTPGHVVGITIDGKDLEIITRDRIEVR